MSGTDCYPWWHATLQPVDAQTWARKVVPSGCSIDYTGSVPCAPEAMRASAEAWLIKNTPQVLPIIGGRLEQDTYTFARYMASEVGSGTIEERIYVGEAGLNRAKKKAGLLGDWRAKLRVLLLPNGRYGAIHAPAAYCATLNIKKMPDGTCNAAGRWAATSRDPKVIDIVLAHFVITGQSGNTSGAETQWGPEALRNDDGSAMGKGTTQTKINSFVRYAASTAGGQYYWVGPMAGVDPWHTFLTKKGPAADTPLGQALIAAGIKALPIDSRGMPIRPRWPADMPICSRGLFEGRSSGTIAVVSGVGLAAALWFGAKWWATRHRTLSA